MKINIRLKALVLILLLSPAIAELISQTNQTDVISSGGGFSQNASYTNFGTLGQAFSSQSQNTYINREGFLNAQFVLPLNVFVSDDYGTTTQIWGYDHFSDLDFALQATSPGGTLVLSNYNHIGDIDITGFSVIVGVQDFFIDGNISGGVVQVTNTGRLVIPPSEGGEQVFPIGDGTNDFTVKITPNNDPGGQTIDIRIVSSSEVPESDGMLSLDLWEMTGPANLDATIVLRLPKAALKNGYLPGNVILRYWNGSRYVAISAENVTIIDNGTYYEITVTNVNEF